MKVANAPAQLSASPNTVDDRMQLVAPTPKHTCVPRRIRHMDTPGGEAPSPSVLLEVKGEKMLTKSVVKKKMEESVIKRARSRAVPRFAKEVVSITPTPKKKVLQHHTPKVESIEVRKLSFDIGASGTSQVKYSDKKLQRSASVSNSKVVHNNTKNSQTPSSVKVPPFSSLHEDPVDKLAQQIAANMDAGNDADSPIVTSQYSSLEDVLGFKTVKEIARTPLVSKNVKFTSPLNSASKKNGSVKISRTPSQSSKENIKSASSLTTPFSSKVKLFDTIPESPLVNMCTLLSESPLV